MNLMDYHCHNRRCGHALGEIEEYIVAGIEKNLQEIGISDHFPLRAIIDDPQLFDIIKKASMDVEEFPKYINEIKALREKYKDKIKIKISTEVNFATPGRALIRQKSILEPYIDDLDYILGAIHDVKWHESPVIIMDPRESSEALKTYGFEKINIEYIKKLGKLVKTDFFDVIAHFDNQRVLFRPKSPNYSHKAWQELLSLLDLIKSRGMAIEINTSGILKKIGSQFPSDKIVREIIQRDIPVMLGSDAHSPEYIGYMFEEFLEKAKKWGLSHLCAYENREQILVKI
ncbi:MAG: histidinol-phosphatase HisJ family protein [Promethearchaeota archaeon]|jgi:histidinol-phosphatase (PHP family)